MGPFKCPECGIWWAGLEHRCAPSQSATDAAGYFHVQPWVPDYPASTTVAPWCVACRANHIPGMGDCTRTYSA